MSSSKKKQLRKEQYMTERQNTAAQEAQKLKRYTVTFWVVIALVACIFIGAISINPIKNVVYPRTDAVTVGDYTLSSVELNYFYVDAVQNYVLPYYSAYGSYYPYFMQLNAYTSLDSQEYTKDGMTWADYFMQSAQDNIKSTYALYSAALKEGHKLTESEQEESIDSTISHMKEEAEAHYNGSINQYLRAIYGNGASEKSYRNYLEVSALARSYRSAYSEDLKFSESDLLDFDNLASYRFNSYTYYSHLISYTSFESYGTKGEDGKVTFTDEQKKAALAAAKEAADELAAGTYKDLDAFDLAIKALDQKISGKNDSTLTATRNEDVLASKLGSLFKDWVTARELKEGIEKNDDTKDSDYEVKTPRKEGDMTVIPYTSGTGDDAVVLGYYVLRFGSINENRFALKDVRHILISCTGTEQNDGSIKFSDETAAKKAKETAEKILEEFKKNPTEENFKTLSETYLKDKTAAEATEYPEVYPNMMVSQFEDWCYDKDRQPGDADIVETTYGYHVMYFVGDSDTSYRSYLTEVALRNETLYNWLKDKIDAIDLEVKTDKHAYTDLIPGNIISILAHSH